MENNFSAVILAGGGSTRMNGAAKSNIMIGGKKIISRMTDTLKDIFPEIIIVTNNLADFSDYNNLILTGDHYPGKGPLGGIHAALLASSKEASFIFAGDMPFLDKKLIKKQIEFYKSAGCNILIPVVDEDIEPLHGIYNKSIRIVLEKYLEEETSCAVRDFFKYISVSFRELEKSEETKTAFMNINSPSDIKVAERLVKIHHY